MIRLSPIFKTLFFVFAMITLACPLLGGCSDNGSTTEPDADTTAPTISLVASESMIRTDSQLVLTATASDNKGVSSVTFFDDDVEFHTDVEAPYEFTTDLTQADNGIHAYKAVARDAAGNEGASDIVEVIVYIGAQVGFVNGGFDTGTDGWDLFNFDPWSGWTDSAGNPPGCMHLNEYGDCAVDPGVTQQVSGLMPGVNFTVSGEYRPFVDWIGDPAHESFVVTVDSVVVGSFARGPAGLDWSDFSVEFTATESVHTIGFWAEHDCDDSSYDLDNVVFEVTP